MLDFDIQQRAHRSFAKMYLNEAEIDHSHISEMTVKKYKTNS